MKFGRTIAFRLFLLIVTVQTIILFGLTIAAMRIQQSHIMENVMASATRASRLLVRSTRQSMLLNQKDDVRGIITSVGNEPGFEGIRIYNKQGEVIFGSDRAEIHYRVDLNAEACVSCHSSYRLGSIPRNDDQLIRIFTKPDGDRVLGLITPIRNEPHCSDAPCHAHPPSKTILGVLDVKMSLAQVDNHLRESRNQLLMFSGAAALMISVVSGRFIWIVVNRPVKRLMDGMSLVSSGRLDQKLEATSTNELGQLARTFNRMTEDLARAREEITEWSKTLEEKVREKTADLARTHRHMVTVEKLASLGTLSATVAHEINNPLEGILTFARLMMRRLAKAPLSETQVVQMLDELKLVADESLRCGNIVKNLLVFARQRGGTFALAELRPIVDRCVMLMNHHARMNAIGIEVACPADLKLECDSDQVQQALIALVSNAIEAMTERVGGMPEHAVHVEAWHTADAETITLRVRDSGCGMNEDVKQHMYDPFFTTKSEGKGVGLGLAVVYGIVQRHHGTIAVDSEEGKGTILTLTLPVRQRAEAVHPESPT